MTTLAEKIDLLFKTFRKPDGSQYTYQEVEEGTNKAVTGAYVWKLRTGKAENPSYKVLKVLSDFFEVPVSFFFEEEVSEEYLQNLKLATQLREDGVQHIALRAGDLDEAGKRAVLEMIEYVRKAQGLQSELNDRDQK
jgi:transcriptional regulator with XRE-family HTH domain